MSQTFYTARPDHLLTKPCEILKSGHNLAAPDRIRNQILWCLIRECEDAPDPTSPFTAEGGDLQWDVTEISGFRIQRKLYTGFQPF